jgi:3-oxoacyl-[acyl-carrier-protein] synthase-3
MQKFARIGPIAFHLPEAVEDNDLLQSLFPKWDMELIYRKTGIWKRHIAAPGETAADLAVVATEKLFREHDIDRDSIDFLLLCTQSPDYILPTTACLLQDRLKLPMTIGALDFNLGCSGYVYGLSLAEGLVRSGAARRILLITAETYSRYIHPTDRSLRTIFGDAAAVTLIEVGDEPSLGGFVFGTDGRGADTLLVGEGGARPAADALKPRKRKRWPSALTMDGPEIAKFALEVLPPMIERVLDAGKWTRDDVELYLMHQATFFLLDQLRARLNLSEAQMPLALNDYGNTVSCTLPLLLHDLRSDGRLKPGTRTMMVGFGVGLSWAGCTWTETWQPPPATVESAIRKSTLHALPGANGDGAADGVFQDQHAVDATRAAKAP